jgi:vancomycin resistance protein YoaR
VAIGTAAAVIVFTGAVLIDAGLGAGRTARRLTLSSRAVGRMDEAELRTAVDEVAALMADRVVTLRAVAGDVPLPARTVGLELDRAAAIAAARAVDNDGPLLVRPLLALRSWFVDQQVPLRFTVDRAKVAEASSGTAAANNRAATEPNIVLQGEGFAAVPGTDGQQLDADALATRLAAVANAAPEGPWTVDVPFLPLPPRFTLEEAQRLAERASTVVRTPLTVVTGGKRTTVPAAKVRTWLRAVPVEPADGAGAHLGRARRAEKATLELQADVEAVIRDVTAAVGAVGSPPTDATFRVAGDKVESVPGKAGTKCCAADTGARVAEAVLSGKTSVNLDLVELPAKQDKAFVEKLGIHEKVASFTSNHPAGQPRVTNIHISADALRGAVVEPGATFSLNNRLGPRTAAKGYVAAGVIMNGKMEEDIGGGVSQLTTTLFNAAFFAGLDVPAYQSHTLYIDRYPYGREATISHPSPDLKIRNQSPYGLLLWTSYSDTSITVTIYSTKWATGEQTGQSKEPHGTCTKVRTERTRTYVSGQRDKDYFTATYQQEAGLLCDGRRTDKPPEERPESNQGNQGGEKPDKGDNKENPPPTNAPTPSAPPTSPSPNAAAGAAANAKTPVR